jgi:hypothetical protein
MVSLNVVLLMHAGIAVSIFYDHEEDHKYHDFQGFQGILLCAARMIVFCFFILGMTQYKAPANSTASHIAKESHYMRIIGLAGTMYLLSLPLVVAFTNFALDNLSQQTFIVFGSFTC